MYNKLLSTLLALCMVLALMPVAVAGTADESAYTAAVMSGNAGESTYTATAVPDNEDESTYTATVMPGSVAATSVATARMTLRQLQDKYPSGSVWNDSFDGSTQCAGFARLLCYEAYGSEFYINNGGKWTNYTDTSYIDNGLKAGDLVRYLGHTSSNGHSVFITGVSGDKVSIADCNFRGGNKIRWTTIDRSDLKVEFDHAYSAPFSLTGTSSTVPTTPTVQPEITFSQSSVSMYVGDSVTVTVGTKSPGSCYVRADPSSSNVYDYSWGSWNSTGTAKPLIITGKKPGKALMTVVMYDGGTNAELTRKEINVSVIDPAQPTSPNLSVDTINTLNHNGDASLYPTVFKGYLRGTDKYEAYADSSGGKSIGRIYPSDELKVQSVYSNNGTLWISALCPWDGYTSDRLIYTKLDAMVNTGFTPFNAIASSSAAVYTRADASQKYGSLGSGDAVTVVGQSGQYVQIIYPLAAGGYKIGWCQISNLVRTAIVDVQANSSTSVTLKYALPSDAANYMVIMDANQRELVRGSISGGGVNIRNMTRGVTYYFYVESVLSNGTGSVTSAVKKVTLK